jgi:hypothetical protein
VGSAATEIGDDESSAEEPLLTEAAVAMAAVIAALQLATPLANALSMRESDWVGKLTLSSEEGTPMTPASVESSLLTVLFGVVEMVSVWPSAALTEGGKEMKIGKGTVGVCPEERLSTGGGGGAAAAPPPPPAPPPLPLAPVHPSDCSVEFRYARH